jgi:hypothetical protein
VSGFSLITIALSEYAEAAWRVEAAESSRKAIEEALGCRGASVQSWTPQATTQKLPGRFRTWADGTGLSTVLYWVGHGEYSDDEYWLALADSQSPLRAGAAFQGRDVASYLRDQQRRRTADDTWVLVILDTCGSGAGLHKIWSSFRPEEMPVNLGVIGTTDDGATFAGGFADALVETLRGFDGNDTDGIPLRDLLRRLEDRLGRNKVQHAFDGSPKLPNRSNELPAMVAPGDIHAELRRVLTQAGDIGNHFYSKAQGGEIGELAWYFTGRKRERRAVARWLETADRGLFVVTGPPGSGKSALLGMVLASTDHALLLALANEGYEAGAPDLHPSGVSFELVLHLSGRSFAEVAAGVAAALGLTNSADPDKLFTEVADRAQAGRRFTILADALDESRDPFTIASGMLRRLAHLPGVRVLVGTRKSLREDPDNPATSDNSLLDALHARPDQLIRLNPESSAIRKYVKRRLRAKAIDLDPAEINRIAREIADRRTQPFLFARLAVHEVLGDPELRDPDAPLDLLLGSGHRGIFAHAVRRYREGEPTTEALLHALAYARGNGFPRTDGVWANAATALHGAPITDVAVADALDHAAPYVMHDTENGQAVYRLAHRTFSEFYRKLDGDNR